MVLEAGRVRTLVLGDVALAFDSWVAFARAPALEASVLVAQTLAEHALAVRITAVRQAGAVGLVAAERQLAAVRAWLGVRLRADKPRAGDVAESRRRRAAGVGVKSRDRSYDAVDEPQAF